MTKRKVNLFCILVSILLTIVFFSCEENTDEDNSNDNDENDEDADVDYIYDPQTVGADVVATEYKDFLENNGHEVNLVEVEWIQNHYIYPDTTDVTELIICQCGEESGGLTEDNFNTLKETGKPIVFLGEPEWNDEELYIFSADYELNSGTSVIPVNPDHSIWNTPNDIDTSGGSVEIYTSPGTIHSIIDIGSESPDVEFLGQESLDSSGYSIVGENNKYYMWGFAENVGDLSVEWTFEGQDLFINFINYVISGGDDYDDDDDDDDDDTTDDDDDDDDDDTSCSWTDPISGLMWQNDETVGTVVLNQDQARTYCQNLTECGHTNWRLPTISELRSLVRGCPGTETGGACGVTDDCTEDGCTNDACEGCLPEHGGPGVDGYYWPPEIREYGNHADWYWSDTISLHTTYFGYLVDFDQAGIYCLLYSIGYTARCVRL